MKTLLVTATIALAGISTAHAQIYRPSVGSGAVVGAVAGGLIGGHNGDRWAEGAIIGGVAGALIGAAMTPQEQVYTPPPVYQTQAPVVYGQQVYGQPTVANAPVVIDQTQAPVQYPQAAPQVVYAPAPQVVYAPAPAPQVIYAPAPAPQIVYVEPAPRVVCAPPVVSFGFGVYSGPRYYGGYPHHYSSHYSHGRRW